MGTANRFFNDFKKFEKEVQSQKLALLCMQVKYMCESNWKTFVIPSLEREPTLYVSCIATHLAEIIVRIQ